MSGFRFQEELDSVLSEYGILAEDVCLVGSVALSLAGVRDNRDVDICLRPEARRRLLAGTGRHLRVSSGGTIALTEHVEAHVERLDVIGLSDNAVFQERMFKEIDGYNVLLPELLLCFKLQRNSRDDAADIRRMEAYAVAAPDWNWGLVRRFAFPPVSAPPPSVPPRRGVLPERLRGLPRRTARFATKAVHDPSAAGAALHRKLMRKHPEDPEAAIAEPAPFLKAQLVTKIATAALLGNQFQGGAFVRYDVLLRYLAIQALVKGSEAFRPLYARMQKQRVAVDTYDDLCRLVASVREHGFLDRHPISITEEGLLVDGSHRLATALWFQIGEVPVTVLPSRERIDYGRQWFVEHGFDEELLARLDAAKDDLLQRNGVWFPVILWPPVLPWFDEIAGKLGSRYRVHWEKNLVLDGRFPDFVRAIYAIDDIERWKVELKVDAMEEYEKKVRVLALELPDPRFRAKELARSYLSVEGEHLKKWIRESYRDRVSDYLYDIVCHTGDNHEHNRQVFDTVNRFANE